MMEWNWKTGCFAVLLLVGALFEVFKNSSNQSVVKLIEKEATVSIMAAFTQPYSVKAEIEAKPQDSSHQIKPVRAAGFSPGLESQIKKFKAAYAQQETEFVPEDKDAKAAKKDKKKKKKKKLAKHKEGDEEDYDYFTDPYTGKTYRRKKKKIAKTEDVKPSDSGTESKDQEDSRLASQTVSTTAVATVQQQQKKEEIVPLDEWIRLLLGQPDPEATKKFVQQYQAGKVTSTVFYQVVKLMIDDARVDMKKMGVLCATLTPSVQSFQVLATVQKGENPGTALYVQVDSAMNAYATLGHLTILQKIMRNNDVYGQVVATQKVEIAATRYLAEKKPAATTDVNGTPTSTPTSNAATHASSFQPFLPILETLSKSKEPTVATQATATLANLQNLLGTLTPTPTTPTVSSEVADDSTTIPDMADNGVVLQDP